MIATLGDLIDDVVVWPSEAVRRGSDTPAQILRRRGGSAANVASMVARSGGAARFIGSIGDDAVGQGLVADLVADGVEVIAPRVAGRPTGTIVVLVDPVDGERSFLTNRSAATALAPAEPSWLDGITALHVPGYSFTAEPLSITATSLCMTAATRGIPVTIDASSTAAIDELGVDAFAALLRELRPDVLFANADEARLLRLGPGAPAEGPALTVIRDGADPTTIVSADGDSTVVPVPPVSEVIDTTGAGDGFSAGWLIARSQGADPAAAATAGHAVAARVLARPGADLAPLTPTV